MPPRPTPLIQASPKDILPPKKTLGLPDVQPNRTLTPIHELGPLPSLSVPHTSSQSIRLRSADQECDPVPAAPESEEPEDEHTISAFGDISLSEIVVPPLPAPARHSILQPRQPPPRLRLKVRRPPMPKRRSNYAYITDPFPYTGSMDDERWPGSPRTLINNSPWLQRQPLASPELTAPRARGTLLVKKGESSLERLFDELIPCSPSIRLSPPGSPARPANGLPQETHKPKSADSRGQNAQQPSPAPAPRQDKPKEAPWRTRLPPRPPIPKWDV